MKFFTPDLLERFGSEDPLVANAAQDEWEERAEEYARKLSEIDVRLPQRFRALLDQFYLHDARVISQSPLMGIGLEWLEEDLRLGRPLRWRVFGEQDCRIPSYWIPLHLDTPPREVLVLQYRSVQIEDAKLHESLSDDCPYLDWLYDEVELIETGGDTEFRHSIFFTRGLEVRLRFMDFDFATLKPMEIPGELAEAREQQKGT
jgi:hypothetical protein